MSAGVAAVVPPSPKHGNAHPYAIKTTSTALLTRSNSTGTNSRAPLHSYTPSPSASSPSHALRGYHRPTRSLSTTSTGSADGQPRPLPMPPSPSTPSRFVHGFPGSDDPASLSDSEATSLVRRSETRQTIPTGAGTPSLASLLSLPENPKVWTPSHLAKYLSSTLRFKEQGAMPERLAADIAAFVYDQKLSGRVFLRLTEADLDAMDVNARWRAALLAASRELRARVLQGRIWGFGSEPEAPPPGSPSGHKRRMPSTVDEGEEAEPGPPSPAHSRTSSMSGRVRDMVLQLERTASESSDDGALAHLVPLPRTPRRVFRRTDTSGNDAGPEDEDGAASDRESDVFMSDSDAGADAEPEPVPVPADEEEDITELHVSNDLTPSKPAVLSDTALVEEPAQEQGVEPSIEDLLEAQGDGDGDGPAWGAKAWETDMLAGETVRRVENLSSESDGSAHQASDTLHTLFGPPPVVPDTPATSVDEPLPLEPPAASKDELDALRAEVHVLETRVATLEAAVVVAEDAARRAAEENRARAIAAELAALDAEMRRAEDEARFDALEARLAAFEAATVRSPARESEEEESGNAEEKIHAADPVVPSLGEVPAYVALVGLGVCAVVMRSMMRRLVTRRP